MQSYDISTNVDSYDPNITEYELNALATLKTQQTTFRAKLNWVKMCDRFAMNLIRDIKDAECRAEHDVTAEYREMQKKRRIFLRGIEDKFSEIFPAYNQYN